MPSSPGLVPGRKGLLPARGCAGNNLPCTQLNGIRQAYERIKANGIYVTLPGTFEFEDSPTFCDCVCGNTPTGAYHLTWNGVTSGFPTCIYPSSGSGIRGPCGEVPGSCPITRIQADAVCYPGGKASMQVEILGLVNGTLQVWITWGTPRPYPQGLPLSGVLKKDGGNWGRTRHRECDTSDASYIIA